MHLKYSYAVNIEQNRTEQMVDLKIPVGTNAHEDTQHTLLFTNMAEDSVV